MARATSTTTMTLEALVAQVQGLSGSEADLGSLQATLRAPAADGVLRANAGALLAALGGLDAEAHSLGCLYIL